MESAPTVTNKLSHKLTNYLRVTFAKNVQQHLCFVLELYSIDKSDLLTTIIKPNHDIDHVFNSYLTHRQIVNLIYDKCAHSLRRKDPKVFTINGGPGTGKSTLIIKILMQFIQHNFDVTKSILVCGVTNHLVDKLAIKVKEKFRNFGKKIIVVNGNDKI